MLDLKKYKFLYEFKLDVAFQDRRHQIKSRVFHIRQVEDSAVLLWHSDTMSHRSIKTEELRDVVAENDGCGLKSLIISKVADNFHPKRFFFTIYLATVARIKEFQCADFIICVCKNELWKVREEMKKSKGKA